jgi:hypothetical protein
MLFRSREVEGRDEHAGFLRAEFRQNVAALVANEAVAVEALAVLGAYAVGGDNWNDVRDRVADHRPTPQARGVEVGIVRLCPDCGRVE